MCRKSIALLLLFFIDLVALCDTALAQSSVGTDLLIKKEKIYLHTDREYYVGGSDIFFKVYLTNSSLIPGSADSEIAYVDLINKSGQIISSKVIRLANGMGRGDFRLTSDIQGGVYVLRAYTSYMRNQDGRHFYRKSIFITDYQTIDIATTNKSRTGAVGIKLFPEGGHLVQGLISKVGVKTVLRNGQGISQDVRIIDSEGNTHATISTDDMGLGVFAIVPKPHLQYHAEVGTDIIIKQNLPDIRDSGLTLSASIIEEELHIKVVKSKDHSAHDLTLIVHTRSAVILQKAIDFSKPVSLNVSLNESPPGILSIGVYDKDISPVAERLVFNHIGVNNFNVDLTTSEEEYGRRELVSLELDVYDDDGQPLSSNLSLSITDHYLTKSIAQNRNIRSHLLFGSELRGLLENPDKYLANIEAPDTDGLELLMLTHGWRGFRKEAFTHKYEAEKTLSITGIIYKKDKPNQVVVAKGIMTALDSDFLIREFESGEDGRFKIEGLDLKDNVNLFLQAAIEKRSKKKKEGQIELKGNKNIDIVIDSRDAPSSTDYDSLMTTVAIFSGAGQSLDDKSIERFTEIYTNKGEEGIGLNVDIEEVVVKAQRGPAVVDYYKKGMTYSKPNTRIMSDDLPNINLYADIYDMIKYRVPGMIFDGPEEEGVKHSIILRGYKTGLSKNTVMRNGARFMINGSFVSTQLAESIRPTSIAFIDVISSLNQLAPYGELGVNGIIMIYLNPPGTQKNAHPKTHNGILNHIYQGYHSAREFYSPDYSQEAEIPDRRDDRITLHWEPNIRIDESGTTYLNFYTGDRHTVYDITVEGISDGGLPIFVKSQFNVTD